MKLIVVTPVFNDWQSLKILLRRINGVISDANVNLSVLVINDASTSTHNTPDRASLEDMDNISGLEVLHLGCNLGHQRAIAIGLTDAVNRLQFDAVIVMDSDGEDDPGDLSAMIAAFKAKRDRIVIARRDRRSEGVFFKMGYHAYRLLFRILTGKTISFGNFCLIPAKPLHSLIYKESLWNHLAATILRSELPLTLLPSKRGKRYAGRSGMQPASLIILGLSAVAVYSDVALLRTLSASLCLSLLSVLSIITVAVIRMATQLAIPGWASDVVGSLMIIFIQSLMLSIFVLFIILANRSHRMFIPAKHYSDYILALETVL